MALLTALAAGLGLAAKGIAKGIAIGAKSIGKATKGIGKGIARFTTRGRIKTAHRAISKKYTRKWRAYKKKTKRVAKRRAFIDIMEKKEAAEKKVATKEIKKSVARTKRIGRAAIGGLVASAKSTFDAFRTSPVPNPVGVFYRLSDNMFKVIMSVIGIAVVLVFISLAYQPERLGDILNSFGLMFAALAAFWIAMISIAVGFARFFQSKETSDTLTGIIERK